jgi:hypothetical protein
MKACLNYRMANARSVMVNRKMIAEKVGSWLTMIILAVKEENLVVNVFAVCFASLVMPVWVNLMTMQICLRRQQPICGAQGW